MVDTNTTKDEIAKEATKPTEIAAEQPVKINVPKAETLPVNQTVPASAAPVPAPTELTPTPPVSQTPEAPLVVSEAEIKEATAAEPEPPTERYVDEIETLTGEVQALEARIDRLTNNVEPAPSEPKASEPKPVEPVLDLTKKETSSTETPPQPTPIPPPAQLAANAAKPVETKGVNDLYAKVAEKEKTAEAQEIKAVHDNLDESTSVMEVIGTISDIISVFGVIVFIILMISPFVKNYIGETVYSAMRSIGWLTTGIFMAVAFLLSFAVKGKWATKIMLVIFLLLSVLMWLGINRNALIAPLETYLGTLFNYYR